MGESIQLQYPLGASVALWRDGQVLVMKRTGGTGAGGWFFPGGHVEGGERPTEACVREVMEETGITIEEGSLQLVDVMSHLDINGLHAHVLIYNAACPPGVEPVVNEEHYTTRWMTPEAYLERFLDAGMLRERGVPESGIALAVEVARVTCTAAEAWRKEHR